MEIIKRNGTKEQFDDNKVYKALEKVFTSLNEKVDKAQIQAIVNEVHEYAANLKEVSSVELIQDKVEELLMKHEYFQAAKCYILYREKRSQYRQIVNGFSALVDENLCELIKKIQVDYPEPEYSFELLLNKFKAFYKPNMDHDECLKMLMKASVELISKEASKWEYIAARFLSYQLHEQINKLCESKQINNYYDKVEYLVSQNYYGSYLLDTYSKTDILELGEYIDNTRDKLFTYSGLDLLAKRYLVCDHEYHILETPQELFMGISMHLASCEKDRLKWAKKIYNILSNLEVTMATPTMSNARKPFHQLSSCFIDTVDDSLTNIYKSIDNFAQVSKYGGGMGMYFGKVRATGSDIRGFKGASGGVIRWIKLVNDTAVAVDQLGVRQGAVAVYLDAWHKDLPEFLGLKTNNGDDRMKAHDVFPAICYPDLFWKMCRQDLNDLWYMMCPHEIYQVKGYHLEDYYGEEWEKRYLDCVNDDRIDKRSIVLKDLVRLILKSAVETGTPFTFNRDHVNRMNPNKHEGMIYCSNLCTEIAQNMSAMEIEKQKIEVENGDPVIIEKVKPGDFVVCNLASLVLGNIDVDDEKHLEDVISTVVRALDNVITLNYFPIPQAQITSDKYRAIGLGCSGYHHLLAKKGIKFDSDEHLAYVDELFEKINYYTLKASMEIAEEKGSYPCFKGSEYDSGEYFKLRGYSDSKWKDLATKIHEKGLRNGYLLAIAPTSSTSIIAGTSAGVDPIINKFFLEEKKGNIIARTAPELNMDNFWLYKSAYFIDQSWLIRAAGIRQRHLDQTQSINLYITNDYTLRQILDLYILAWEQEVKTIYYVRSKSLEVEECESCAS